MYKEPYISLIKHAIDVLKTSSGTRKSRIKGIYEEDLRYYLHINSLSQFFCESEASRLVGTVIQIFGKNYKIDMENGWFILMPLE